MFENKSYFNITKGSERNFGFVFTVFFSIISLYFYWFSLYNFFWPLTIAFIFLFFSIFFPKLLAIPNKLWFKFSILLGAFIAPIIMGIIFYFVVTPTGLIMRLIGKDLLNQKFYNAKKSSWIKRKDPLTSMKNQF